MIDRRLHLKYIHAAASDFLNGEVSLHNTVDTIESVLSVLEDPALDKEFCEDVFALEEINALIHEGGFDFERLGRDQVESAAERIMDKAKHHLIQFTDNAE